MAAELEPLMAEWLGAEKAEDTRGQAASLNTMEDLLETVKKLQKEGSLEPQIEDLIHRINELQQGPAEKRSSEELGEAQALQEAMHRELDSLNEERVHLEEVLRKKQGTHILTLPTASRSPPSRAASGWPLQEAVSILKKHPQERDSDTPHLDAQQLEERLADLASQHKDLWEFHVLQQRLAQEISTMEHRKDQLLAERTLLRARLEKVEQRLQEARETWDSPGNCGLKTELEELEGQSQRSPEAQNDKGEASQEEQHHLETSEELPRTGTPC